MSNALSKATQEDVDYILRHAPRLMKVAGATAISYGLFKGANQALLDNKNDGGELRQIIAGYRGDCTLIVASRLTLLLDPDNSMVSFQTLYHRLKNPETVELLVHQRSSESILPEQREESLRGAIDRFLVTYRAIDWKDLHGRLVHFRNRGVAHLTPDKIEKRVKYSEIEKLAFAVAIMGECMSPLASNDVPVRADEIEEWSERARKVWASAMERGSEQ